MSIEARTRLLPDWFARLRTHQLALPRFQRWEAWDAGNISQIFNTILRDLPVGAVLVLEIGNETPFVARGRRNSLNPLEAGLGLRHNTFRIGELSQ
jgi:hypothetical protein